MSEIDLVHTTKPIDVFIALSSGVGGEFLFKLRPGADKSLGSELPDAALAETRVESADRGAGWKILS